MKLPIAARMGGADPTGNMRLKLALQKARENNIPKDNIQRAIDKGVGATDMNAYEESYMKVMVQLVWLLL